MKISDSSIGGWSTTVTHGIRNTSGRIDYVFSSEDTAIREKRPGEIVVELPTPVIAYGCREMSGGLGAAVPAGCEIA